MYVWSSDVDNMMLGQQRMRAASCTHVLHCTAMELSRAASSSLAMDPTYILHILLLLLLLLLMMIYIMSHLYY